MDSCCKILFQLQQELERIVGIDAKDKLSQYWTKDRVARALEQLAKDGVAKSYARIGQGTNLLGLYNAQSF